MKKRKITVKQISIASVLFLLLSLLPVLILSFYNFPSADDFASGSRGRLVWLSTHSLPAVLEECVRYTAELYRTWSGDLFTMFFTVLQPDIFGESVSFVVPWVMLGLLCTGTFYLFHTVLGRGLGMEKAVCNILASLFLFLEIQCMVSGVEGFFWYTGAINYTFPYALNLYLLGFLCRIFLSEERKKQNRYVVLAFLFECMAGAGNYTIIINMLLVNLTLLAAVVFRKAWHRLWQVLLPFAGFLVFFVINVTAPGNAVRSATTESSFGAVKSIVISLYYALEYPFEHWMDWTLLAGFGLMVPFLWHGLRRVRFSFPMPLLAAAYGYCLLSATFTAPLFGSGNIEAGRIQDMIFMQFLLVTFAGLVYGLGWLSAQMGLYRKAAGETDGQPGSLSSNQALLALALAVFLAFGGAMTAKTDPDHYMATSALQSLLSGEAATFRAENLDRIALLRDESLTEVTLDPFTAQPHLLYFSDIRQDAGEWENLAMCRFYGKEKIVLAPEK